MKRLCNKYGKNSRNNKFFKILLLQREKAKKGFVKSANFAKIAKVTEIFLAKWQGWVTNVAKIARITKFNEILHLEREKAKKGFEMSANFSKIAKITRIFLPMWKDWVTNMAKNCKNNKFHKILHLERGKVKKGFEMSANFAKIAKVTRIFHAMWKDWATNMAKIARITNFTKFYT